MTKLSVGDKAPDFTLPTDGNGSVTLSGLRGQKVVLFFYPKDNTPGCTQEACEFNDDLSLFDRLGVKVIGLSKCSVKKHDNFKAKYGFNFPLASDEADTACEDYGVFVEKKNFGKTYMGIQRTTFLIDEDGVIAHVWPKVRVKGHVDEVKAVIQDLAKAA